MSYSKNSVKAHEKNQAAIVYRASKSQELEKENTRNKHRRLFEQSKSLGKANGNSQQKAIRAPSRIHSSTTGSKSHLVLAGDFLLPSTSVSSINNDQRNGRRDEEADLQENLEQFARNICNYIRDRSLRSGSHVTIHELNDELRKANAALKKKEGTEIGRLWKLFRLVEGPQHFNAITIDSYKEITKNKLITDNSEEPQIQRPTVIMNSAGVSAKRQMDEEVQILNEDQMDLSSVPREVFDLYNVDDNQDASFEVLDSQLAEVFHEEEPNDDELAHGLGIQNVGQTYANETKTTFEELYDK